MNLSALHMMLFLSAKRRYTASVFCGFFTYLIGVLAIWAGNEPKISALLVALLAIVSEIFIWNSDDYRDKGNFVLRRNEFKNSFGWKIEKSDLSDLLVNLPERFEKSLSAPVDKYFASSDEPGPRTAMRNLEESSWYSKHLANQAAWIYGVIIFLLISVSIISLIISVNSVNEIKALESISRIVTSTLLLVFSMGMIRTVFGFSGFSDFSSQTESKAMNLLRLIDINSEESMLLLHDYQVARSSSPLIPQWIWNWKGDKLNRLWEKHRNQSL
jgi:hypothetical protein